MARTYSDQISLAELDEKYGEFVEKFKAKKTTDDCYTPAIVFDAVKEWAVTEYGIDPEKIVRPFYPGGDYERFNYAGGVVVLDNPPFSIIGKIVYFYLEHKIPFFLFAPYLTNCGIGSGDKRVCHIITASDITYENGATVNTSFVTNLDSRYIIRTAPELAAAIKRADAANRAADAVKLPVYRYPPQILRSTDCGYMAEHGVSLNIPKGDAAFLRVMDVQKQHGKSVFGAGFYLSERAAAARLEAIEAMKQQEANKTKRGGAGAADLVFELSEREKMIVELLGKDSNAPEWELMGVEQ